MSQIKNADSLKSRQSDFDDFTSEVMSSINAIRDEDGINHGIHTDRKSQITHEKLITFPEIPDIPELPNFSDAADVETEHESNREMHAIYENNEKVESTSSIDDSSETHESHESSEPSFNTDYEELDNLLNFSQNIVDAMSTPDLANQENQKERGFDSAFRYHSTLLVVPFLLIHF